MQHVAARATSATTAKVDTTLGAFQKFAFLLRIARSAGRKTILQQRGSFVAPEAVLGQLFYEQKI